jgi:O-Antigen ligase
VRENARVPRSALAVASVPLVLVPALGAVQGGFLPGAWVWSAALAAWAAALGIVLAREVSAPAAAWAWLAASAALLGWTMLSTLWSVHAAQSVLEARRGIVYVTVMLALVVLARRGSTRLLVASTHVAVSGLVLYALARYLYGPIRAYAFEGYSLNQPLGYANAVGILAALGILLGLGLVAHEGSRAIRAGAAATVPLLALALVLTGSNASWLALAAGVAVTALLDASPVGVIRSLALTAPGAAILVWLGHRSGLAAGVATPHPSARVLAVVAAGCAAATGALAALIAPREGATGRRLVVAAVVCAALAGGAIAIRVGSTQPRASYWHVARQEYRAHPLLGSGAGTFARYWEQSGDLPTLGGALDAHSLYLETLAELGPIGLALLAAMLLLPLRSAALRHRATYVPAAAGTYVAFLFHAGLDWDWEMPAVVVAALACAAALLLDDAAPRRSLAPRARVALLAGTLVLGALAIVGTRSHTVPAAAPKTEKAPPRRGLLVTFSAADRPYGLPLW